MRRSQFAFARIFVAAVIMLVATQTGVAQSDGQQSGSDDDCVEIKRYHYENVRIVEGWRSELMSELCYPEGVAWFRYVRRYLEGNRYTVVVMGIPLPDGSYIPCGNEISVTPIRRFHDMIRVYEGDRCPLEIVPF